MRERIIALIHEVNIYAEVESNTHLLEEGVLDSLSMLFLIELLESEYSFKVPEEELRPENFLTVDTICDLVKRVRFA